MASNATGAGSNYFLRSRAYLTITSDWTRLVWGQLKTVPAAGLWHTLFLYGDKNLITAYVWVGVIPESGVPKLLCQVWKNSGLTLNSDELTVSLDIWNAVALLYNSTTKILTLKSISQFGIITPVGTIAVDLGSFAIAGSDDAVAGDTAVPSGFAVAYDRVWQSQLTDDQLLAESRSAGVVLSANLVAAVDLATPQNLTKPSGPVFSVVGSIALISGPITIGSERSVSPLFDAGGNYLVDADGYQLFAYTSAPPPQRTCRVRYENRAVRVPAE